MISADSAGNSAHTDRGHPALVMHEWEATGPLYSPSCGLCALVLVVILVEYVLAWNLAHPAVRNHDYDGRSLITLSMLQCREISLPWAGVSSVTC